MCTNYETPRFERTHTQKNSLETSNRQFSGSKLEVRVLSGRQSMCSVDVECQEGTFNPSRRTNTLNMKVCSIPWLRRLETLGPRRRRLKVCFVQLRVQDLNYNHVNICNCICSANKFSPTFRIQNVSCEGHFISIFAFVLPQPLPSTPSLS